MKKAYFISDIHLTDEPSSRERERTVCRFLDSIAADAESLYLVGDIIDFWWEYRTVAPRGFVRFFGALARLADAGVRITWLKGNHDIWLKDYLRDEIGLTVHDGILRETILGSRFFIEHGDGVGRRPRSFRMMRRLFRNPLAQAAFAAIHPRWSLGLAHACSRGSRRHGENSPSNYSRQALTFLTDFCNDTLATDPDIDFFVFGHIHRAELVTLSNQRSKAIFLGDWLRLMTYGVFDGSELRLCQFR